MIITIVYYHFRRIALSFIWFGILCVSFKMNIMIFFSDTTRHLVQFNYVRLFDTFPLFSVATIVDCPYGTLFPWSLNNWLSTVIAMAWFFDSWPGLANQTLTDEILNELLVKKRAKWLTINGLCRLGQDLEIIADLTKNQLRDLVH